MEVYIVSWVWWQPREWQTGKMSEKRGFAAVQFTTQSPVISLALSPAFWSYHQNNVSKTYFYSKIQENIALVSTTTRTGGRVGPNPTSARDWRLTCRDYVVMLLTKASLHRAVCCGDLINRASRFILWGVRREPQWITNILVSHSEMRFLLFLCLFLSMNELIIMVPHLAIVIVGSKPHAQQSGGVSNASWGNRHGYFNSYIPVPCTGY